MFIFGQVWHDASLPRLLEVGAVWASWSSVASLNILSFLQQQAPRNRRRNSIDQSQKLKSVFTLQNPHFPMKWTSTCSLGVQRSIGPLIAVARDAGHPKHKHWNDQQMINLSDVSFLFIVKNSRCISLVPRMSIMTQLRRVKLRRDRHSSMSNIRSVLVLANRFLGYCYLGSCRYSDSHKRLSWRMSKGTVST